MVESHAWLDAQSPEEARAVLLRCCGSMRWVEGMMARRPFASAAGLALAAEVVWGALGRDDYLEAFAHHPAIGAEVEPAANGEGTAGWSREEQSGVASADERTRAELHAANLRYRDRFGYVFLVCATGKSAGEMLSALRIRLENEPEAELANAAAEQAKITALRLEKLGR